MAQPSETLVRFHGPIPDHSDQDALLIGRTLLAALGASGPLSSQQLEAFVQIATSYGARPDQVDAWRAFVAPGPGGSPSACATTNLADEPPLPPRLARHLIYEAIRVTRAQGAYDDADRARVAEAARLLHVHKAVVNTLEGIVGGEATLREARVNVEAIMQRGGLAKMGASMGLQAINDQDASIREQRLELMNNGLGLPPT